MNRNEFIFEITTKTPLPDTAFEAASVVVVVAVGSVVVVLDVADSSNSLGKL